ncbi:MAG: DNA adenine methylase [Elusimicrobiota bacterium]
MQSIFRYPGGKTKSGIKRKIMGRFPYKYEEYREPFVGGGDIFFSIPIQKKRWINDINKDLISVYLALKNRPKEFELLCNSIAPHKETEETKEKEDGQRVYNKRMRQEFFRLIDDENADPALRYFFVNRTVWGGRVNYNIRSRLYFSNPTGWNIIKTNKLEQASEILQNVKITHTDYQSVMMAPGKDVFIYLDPPYVVNTGLSRSSQLYQFNFSIGDHRMLAKIFKKCPHKILMSYDNDEEGVIKEMYQDIAFIQDESWAYCGTSSSEKHSKKKKIGRELLISNYPVETTVDMFSH